MRLFLAFLFLLTPFALATQEVVAPHVRVLFDNPELESYAQQVAFQAERALEVLIPLFDHEPQPITIIIDDTTGIYNAVASPLPRPRVALRPLFPLNAEIGYRTRNALYLLLLHELTHNVQLTYTARPADAPEPLHLGLVGEGVARVPPSWFVEGIATWAESQYSAGGRRDDALTIGLLRTAALGDNFPTLTEASLISYQNWPGGMTRYLFGVGFVDYLIMEHGFEAMLATLRHYNAGGFFGTFSAAWQEAVGTELADEWAAWRHELAEQARARATEQAGELLTDTGWYTGAPAVSPDGERLAWVSWPSSIVVAEILAGGELGEPRTVLSHRAPDTLSWLDDDTLVYARIVRKPRSAFSELFALDVNTGLERQLTSGARAKLAEATIDGCILFVRDVIGEGSSLQRWCSGTIETLWTTPAGAHIVGVAASEAGRIALSIWRHGLVDLALLYNGEIMFLTQGAAQDLDPTWRGEKKLVFRSDRSEGVFDLYELELESLTLSRLTRTLGGAFEPAAFEGGIFYAQLGAKGYNIAVLDESQALEIREWRPGNREEGDFNSDPRPLTPDPRPPAPYPVRPYSPLPSLSPYGWLPTGGYVSFSPFDLGLSVAVLGQDDSGLHSYALNLGYDSALTGLLSGAYANLRYSYNADGLLGSFGSQGPVGFAVQLGLWPHTPHLHPVTETALGVQSSVTVRLPLDQWAARLSLQGGVLRLESYGALQFDGRVGAALSNQRADLWGYRERGWRFGLTGVWSATEAGASPGVWVDVHYVQPLDVGVLELSTRFGYRQAPPLPVALDTYFATTLTAGYRYSLPLEWRYGDGLYAIERLTLEPRVRGWLDSEFGIGGDLTVSLDTVLGYSAPVSFSGTLGYAEGVWYRFGLGLPL